MKSLSAGLQAHYEASSTTICTIWKITRRDGEVFTFTDLDRDVIYDGLTYAARTGYTRSQLESKLDLSTDNLEAQGLLDSSGITLAELEAGFWDAAEYEISEINYQDVSQGRNLLSKGWLGRARRGKTGLYLTELRGLTSKLQQNVGRVVLPSCDAILGDSRCTVDLGPFTMTGIAVDSVESVIGFTASGLEDSPPSNPAGWFTFGIVTFTTGQNAGVSREIKLHSSGGVLLLQDPFPFPVAVADEFTAIAGCNKLHKLADGTYNGDCKVKFDNVVNFRGYSEVPLMNEVARGGR